MQAFEPIYPSLNSRPYLPLVEYGFAQLEGETRPSAVLKIDTTARPDAADAIRRVIEELDGPDRTVDSKWHLAFASGDAIVLLDARLARPIACSLRMVFSITRHAEILWSICQTGVVGLTTERVATDLNDVIHSPIFWFRVPPDLPKICAAAAAYASLLARAGTADESEGERSDSPVIDDSGIPAAFRLAFAD